MKSFFLSSSFFFASDLAVAADAVQLHLPADPEPEEHAQHSPLIGHRRLRFHAAAELQLHPLRRIRPQIFYRNRDGTMYAPASLITGALWALHQQMVFILAAFLSLAAISVFVFLHPAPTQLSDH
jgi:hypothetical protein